MTKPAHSSLFQQCVHGGASRSFQDSFVRDLALPCDVQNSSEATHVEGIHLTFMSGAHSPELAAIQEHAHNTGSVDLIFVCSVSLLLFHTFFVSLVMVVAALPIRLISSASSERVSEIVEPR